MSELPKGSRVTSRIAEYGMPAAVVTVAAFAGGTLVYLWQKTGMHALFTRTLHSGGCRSDPFVPLTTDRQSVAAALENAPEHAAS